MRANGVHLFKRATTLPSFNVQGVGLINNTFPDYCIRFTLASTRAYQNGAVVSTASNTGASELTGLFREYRLRSVKVTLIYSGNMLQGNGTLALPTLFARINNTDNIPPNAGTILQTSDLKCVQLGNLRNKLGWSVKFKPNSLTAVFDYGNASGDPTGFARSADRWLPTSSPEVLFYGLDIVRMAQGTGEFFGTVVPLVEYEWECRHTL